MDLSFYKTEELDNLGVNVAMDIMANHEKTPHTIKNIEHLQHRITVWEQKQATLDLMKEKMLEAEDDEEDIIGMVSEAETDVYRIMKYDIDSFMAKQEQIDHYEQEEQIAANKKPKDDEEDEEDEEKEGEEDLAYLQSKNEEDEEDEEDEGEEDLGYLKSFAAKIDHYDNKMSDIMQNIRTEYKDITFLQCLVYCHLVVFSIAATVGYMFYTPPNSAATQKMKDNMLINIPVNFQSIKTPKKEIKKQLKNLVEGKKDTKESML